jgi:hypothetical protein
MSRRAFRIVRRAKLAPAAVPAVRYTMIGRAIRDAKRQAALFRLSLS